MKRFRKRKSIKLTLAMAVVAAVAVPVAQADPQPLQKLESTTVSVAPISENSPQYAARQAPGPIVDGHHQALLDRQQGGLLPGVNAAGLRYQALAAHYAQATSSTSSTPSPISDNSPAFGHGGPQVSPSTTGGGSSFDWGDAAAGFGVAIGLVALMGIGVALLGSRHRTAPA